MISTSSVSSLATRGGARRRLAAVGLTCALAAGPTAAQQVDTEVPLVPSETAPALDLSPAAGELHLSIEEAIAIALERNLDLLVSRNSYQDSVFGVQDARGFFDLQLTAGVSASDDESPTVSELEGADVLAQEGRQWSLGLAQPTPIGGEASLDWVNSRLETNDEFAIINPAFQSGLTLGYTQPLLEGFGRTVARNEILVAQQNREIGRGQFEAQVIATAQEVANAYWGLVEARQQLGVAQEALALAEELHEQNKIRVDVGTLAPLELVQSEAGVATQREEIIRARTAVGDAADQLRLLLNLEQGPLWTAELIPETEPSTEPIEIDLQGALATARQDRVELAIQEASVEQAHLGVAVARSFFRPRLDLNLSYTYSGVGGDVLNPDTGVITPGGFSDALDQVTGQDFPGWQVGLQFAYPLQNRSGRARRASAEIAVDSAEILYEQLHQQVATEVRSAARNLESAWEQVESARASRRLQERSLEAEQKRFDNGMSTSFQVLQVQNELTAARSREVAATVGYNRAVIEYHRAVGELLETTGIRLVGNEEEEEQAEAG